MKPLGIVMVNCDMKKHSYPFCFSESVNFFFLSFCLKQKVQEEQRDSMIALKMTKLPGNARQDSLPQTGTPTGDRDVTQTSTCKYTFSFHA